MTDSPTDPIDNEIAQAPFEHTLKSGAKVSIAHEVTLPAVGKDRAVEISDSRGQRGMAVALLRLATSREDFGHLESVTDDELMDVYVAWLEHCGLGQGKSSASTS